MKPSNQGDLPAPDRAPHGRGLLRQPALVVQLEGALVNADIALERGLLRLRARIEGCFRLEAGAAGRAGDIDVARLPYNAWMLGRLERAHEAGREIFLVSRSPESFARRVAEHLALFDGVFAPGSAIDDLAGAQRVVEEIGPGNFDYIGSPNLGQLWSAARRACAAPIGAAQGECGRFHQPPPWRAWVRALRMHQYAKNMLVFVPLLSAHLFTAQAGLQACLAFVAFCLCASSVYILNDVLDLQDDRAHRSKRFRPLAAGEISLRRAMLCAVLLLSAGVGVAAAVSAQLLVVALAYFALTSLYSLGLKRVMLLDVVTLAGLYSLRVLGGAVAVQVGVSKWLVGFCLAIFMSLALIKRYVEIAARVDAQLPDASHRDYQNNDLTMIGALAAAAGFNAVTVLALYVASDATHMLYGRPEILFLVCPVLAYWIARALMLAHRRMMHDDPVVFALRDRASHIVLALVAALVVAAT